MSKILHLFGHVTCENAHSLCWHCGIFVKASASSWFFNFLYWVRQWVTHHFHARSSPCVQLTLKLLPLRGLFLSANSLLHLVLVLHLRVIIFQLARLPGLSCWISSCSLVCTSAPATACTPPAPGRLILPASAQWSVKYMVKYNTKIKHIYYLIRVKLWKHWIRYLSILPGNWPGVLVQTTLELKAKY